MSLTVRPPDFALDNSPSPLRIWQFLPLAWQLLGWPMPASPTVNNKTPDQIDLEEAVASLCQNNGNGNQHPPQLPNWLKNKRRLCLVLIDGMGQQLLEQRRGHIPFLRKHLKQAQNWFGQQPHTCIPSTTVAALTSLHTGRTPGQTGMLGYECWDPEQQVVRNLITFHTRSDQRGEIPTGKEKTLSPLATTPNSETKQPSTTPENSTKPWSEQPTFFTIARENGLNEVAFVPEKFIGTDLTKITLRDATIKTERNWSQRVQAAIKEFKSGADYVYLYWSDLDHAGHQKGWQSPEWTAELENVDSGLQTLANNLPEDVLLIITADHGMVDRNIAQTVDLSHGPLAEHILQVAGEPRALQVFLPTTDTVPAKAADSKRPRNRHAKAEVLKRWRAELGSNFYVTDDYQSTIGAVSEVDRLGDLMIFSSGAAAVIDTRFHSAGACSLIGVHGSLTAAELEIPLIML